MYHYYCTEVCLAHQILEQFGGELSLVGSGTMAKFRGSGRPLAAVSCRPLAAGLWLLSAARLWPAVFFAQCLFTHKRYMMILICYSRLLQKEAYYFSQTGQKTDVKRVKEW